MWFCYPRLLAENISKIAGRRNRFAAVSKVVCVAKPFYAEPGLSGLAFFAVEDCDGSRGNVKALPELHWRNTDKVRNHCENYSKVAEKYECSFFRVIVFYGL